MSEKYKKEKDIKNRRYYAIFCRLPNGKLVAMIDKSLVSMGWSDSGACLWDEPPSSYFKPQEGHFLVVTSRKYSDLEFTGNRWKPRPRNWEWKPI